MNCLIRFLALLLIPAFLLAPPGSVSAQDENESLAKDSSTEINVRNADLAAVVRIFSKKTKRNYILDEKVSGKVSIYLPGKISSNESIKILDSVLALKGFTSVPIGENLWKIVPAKDAKQSTIPTIIGEDGEYTNSSSMITRLYTLKFVTADDMKQLLSPLVSGNGLVNAYTGTNSLIIIDSEDNIERLLRIVRELDVPFSDREMTIIPINYADAPDIADKLKELLLEDSSNSSNKSATNAIRSRLSDSSSKANRKSTIATSSSSSTISARLREPKIIADERTNSVIVVADEETTARIRALISQLDSEVNRGGQRFYVYRCQHASAEELAEVLSGLVGGGTTSSSGSSSGTQSTGQRAAERSSNRLSQQRRTPGQSRNAGQSSGGISTVSLGEETSITADPATNSLVINSGKSDYEKIRSLLDQLDVKRRQVLVEAMLLEVGITDSQTTGMEFITSTGGSDGGVVAQSNFGNLSTLISDPTQLANFSVAAASSGSLTLPGDIVIPSQTVLLTAAQTNSNVNVLSSPNILATDNEQAEIVVGQNVPFLASTSSSSDNLNNTFNQIDRQDVGITLRLTPQISSNNYVTLSLFTEVSNVVGNTAGSELGPTTTVRTSETTVITRDGQMVVIGGLISDDVQSSESGVPFLKDIPLIGHAFKSHNDAITRTNLLIFITPRIVKDQFDARDITRNNRDKLQYEMHNNDLYPSRSEVLENPEIDSVIEQPSFETSDSGPILPPSSSGIKQGRSFAEMNNSANAKPSKPTSSRIELKVKPRLPNETSSLNKTSDVRAAMKPSLGLRSTGGSKYIVLESINKLPKSVPFNRIGSSNRFGIMIPAGAASSASDFFKQGGQYTYKLEGIDVALKAVRVFSSEAKVREAFPEAVNSWHTLSPYEVMNIGKYPWVRSK